MALRQGRIGSNPDAIQYDDGDFATAMEVDDPIRVNAAPINAADVLRLGDLPAALGGASGNVTVITALQAGGVGPIGFQYKNRTLTFSSGIITVIGAESAWTDV
jgi:hypothetical protein